MAQNTFQDSRGQLGQAGQVIHYVLNPTRKGGPNAIGGRPTRAGLIVLRIAYGVVTTVKVCDLAQIAYAVMEPAALGSALVAKAHQLVVLSGRLDTSW